MRRTIPLLLATLGAACGPASDKPLGPADSYVLLTTTGQSPAGFPIVREARPSDELAQPFGRLFADGFASEMLRTLYLAKALLANGVFDGRHFPEAARAAAADPVCLLIGTERDSLGRGLAFPRWLRDPVERLNTLWLGFTNSVATDRAVVQTLSGRLAALTIGLVSTGGAFTPDNSVEAPLADAYRMAMEVVAREWRVGSGPKGTVPFDAGTAEQRKLFADIRENRLVLTDNGAALRPADELLRDPRVAATVLYRLAQAKSVGQRVAPDDFYAPFNLGQMPAGISPGAILGSFRNFQAKLLATWGRAVLLGHPPGNIADLLDAYTTQFPAERAEAVRIFLVTTFAGTVKPGGVSIRPEDSTAAIAELADLAAAVTVGRRTLRDAVSPALVQPSMLPKKP